MLTPLPWIQEGVHLFLSLEELQHLQPFLMLWIKLRRRVVAVKVFHHVFLHIISESFSCLEKLAARQLDFHMIDVLECL